MASFDTADCLVQIRRQCRIQDVTEYPADADLYAFLRDGENRVKHEVGSMCPEILRGAPVLMTSADGGYTYTFGVDGESNAIAPIGHVSIYPSRSQIPFEPLISGVEYVFEGTKIRFTEYTPRTFGDGPYAQFITPTLVIAATTTLVTLPVQLRLLAVHDACIRYAQSGAVLDSTPYEAAYESEFQRQISTAQLNRSAGAMRYPRETTRTFWRGGR